MFNIDHTLLKELNQLVHRVEERYNNKLDKILRKLEHMSKEIDALTAQVKANNDLLDSATVLINGIADRIVAAGGDPVKLAALTDELRSKDEVLADAIKANTPA